LHRFDLPPGEGEAAVETDGIDLIIIAVFAIAGLVLMFACAFMQDFARTIETWRELKATW